MSKPTHLAATFVATFLVCAPFVVGSPLAGQATAVAEPATNAVTEAAIERIDAALAANYPTDGPGAAVLIKRGDDVLLRKGYGLAHVELGVPIEPDMVFRIGSITKQFTGVAMMLLVEEGKVDLQAPITTYLPDFPMGEPAITVEHLLHHTSGLKSYTGMPSWRELVRDDLSVEEMVAVFKDEPRDFEPGSDWRYNNSGYFLAGAVIEAASGMTYAEFLQDRLFEPLGMKSTSYGGAEKIVPRRAAGYAGVGDALRNAGYISMTQPYAAGSLLSSVDDLARWTEALGEGRLLSFESRRKLWTPHRLPDGRSTRYGYGWGVWEYEGHPVIQHGGAIPGYLSDAIWLPEDELFIAILANVGGTPSSPSDLTERAMGLLVGKPLDARAAVAVSPEDLAAYTGVYQIGDDEEDLRVVTVEDGVLTTQRGGSSKQQTVAVSDDTFAYVDSTTQLRFLRDASGKVVGSELLPGYGPAERAMLTDRPIPAAKTAIDLDAEILASYVGSYQIQPGFQLVITQDENGLVAQATGQAANPIFPESETVFFSKVVDATVEFIPGDAGQASKLILRQGDLTLEAPRVD